MINGEIGYLMRIFVRYPYIFTLLFLDTFENFSTVLHATWNYLLPFLKHQQRDQKDLESPQFVYTRIDLLNPNNPPLPRAWDASDFTHKPPLHEPHKSRSNKKRVRRSPKPRAVPGIQGGINLARDILAISRLKFDAAGLISALCPARSARSQMDVALLEWVPASFTGGPVRAGGDKRSPLCLCRRRRTAFYPTDMESGCGERDVLYNGKGSSHFSEKELGSLSLVVVHF